jgi:hypothetical protein
MAERDVSLGGHRRLCSVCQHAEREEIEAAFIAWTSPASITVGYGLSDRASVYRHSHAMGSSPSGRGTSGQPLTHYRESGRSGRHRIGSCVSGPGLRQINSAGAWIDRTEMVSMNDLFAKMTTQELETYANTGVTPAWFKTTVDET